MSISISDFSRLARAMNADDKVVIGMGADNKEAVVSSATHDKVARAFGLAKTSQGENNAVRDLFLKSLLAHMSVDSVDLLPASVKAVLKIKDYGMDAEARATSGKPLTARRISEVMTEVAKCRKEHLKGVTREFCRGMGIDSFLGTIEEGRRAEARTYIEDAVFHSLNVATLGSEGARMRFNDALEHVLMVEGACRTAGVSGNFGKVNAFGFNNAKAARTSLIRLQELKEFCKGDEALFQNLLDHGVTKPKFLKGGAALVEAFKKGNVTVGKGADNKVNCKALCTDIYKAISEQLLSIVNADEGWGAEDTMSLANVFVLLLHREKPELLEEVKNLGVDAIAEAAEEIRAESERLSDIRDQAEPDYLHLVENDPEEKNAATVAARQDYVKKLSDLKEIIQIAALAGALEAEIREMV